MLIKQNEYKFPYIFFIILVLLILLIGLMSRIRTEQKFKKLNEDYKFTIGELIESKKGRGFGFSLSRCPSHPGNPNHPSHSIPANLRGRSGGCEDWTICQIVRLMITLLNFFRIRAELFVLHV